MATPRKEGQAVETASSPAAMSRMKRGLDIALSAFLLVFFLPTFALVAIAIFVESGGPILFRQRRTGLDGVEFRILKFRTMTVLEDGAKVSQASRTDQRVTRVGSVLRRLSIDELPQFWNVLMGDMSLVGPRPHALAHDQHFGRIVRNYPMRFRVRPGITGLAQVKGLRGEIRSDNQIVERIREDNNYIEEWSFLLDLWILIKTLFVTPFHSNAY
ncbi:sugar transferase [Caulobacter hibisci]|uniref:Sugar transferase n=2 Tax=Caulobacter hibisci TaxID=2035993 RepID=A0ABS0T3G1_9CAUL|nr:sugar transferase [Caulobacter hibisci]